MCTHHHHIMVSSITTSIRWPLSKAESQRENEDGLDFVPSVPTLKTLISTEMAEASCAYLGSVCLYHKLHLYLLLTSYILYLLFQITPTRYAKALLVPVKLSRVVKAPKHRGTQIKYLYLHDIRAGTPLSLSCMLLN
jgi:hypothetical protein